MKKLYHLALLVFTVFFTTALMAETNRAMSKPIKEHQLKKMDSRLTQHKTKKRAFRTQKEFEKIQHKRARATHRDERSLHRGRLYGEDRYPRDTYQHPREQYTTEGQRGARNFKRGWYLAYRYDRASFYDRNGYYYGYFNRYGYYFEEVFYRYDRYYSYRDRVRGRGLFDRRYYTPENYRYYGFVKPQHYRSIRRR